MASRREDIGTKRRFDVLSRDRFTCQYCGRKPPEVVLNCDHIHPVSKGGGNEMENLITSCEACNLGKGAVTLDKQQRLVLQGEILSRIGRHICNRRLRMYMNDDMLSAKMLAARHLAELWYVNARNGISVINVRESDFVYLLCQFRAEEIAWRIADAYDTATSSVIDARLLVDSFLFPERRFTRDHLDVACEIAAIAAQSSTYEVCDLDHFLWLCSQVYMYTRPLKTMVKLACLYHGDPELFLNSFMDSGLCEGVQDE